MTAYEQRILTEALQADADMRSDAMRQVVCVVCLIIISCVAVGAGFRSVRNIIEARQAQQEVRK